MINYKVIKNLSNIYSNIDKEMFYRSLYNMYKNKDVEIDLSQLGIPEHIYISLLDLPLIEIKNGTINDFSKILEEKFDSNNNMNVDELSTAIFSSIHSFFLLRNEKEFYFCGINIYFCGINKSMFRFNFKYIPIKNFIQFYRKQILLKLEV